MKDYFISFAVSLSEWYLLMLTEKLEITVAGVVGIFIISVLLVTSDRW